MYEQIIRSLHTKTRLLKKLEKWVCVADFGTFEPRAVRF